MNDRIRRLQEQAGTLLRQGDDIRDRYKASTEPMSAEDNVTYTEVMERYDNTMRDIAEEFKAEERAKALATPVSEIVQPTTGEPLAVRGEHTAEEVMKAYGDFLRNGERTKQATLDVLKAYQADNEEQGGIFVAPEQVVAGLLKRLDNMVFLRDLATKYQVAKAESLGIVTLEDDVDDPVWTSELATGDEDEGMTFGKRALFPHPLAKQVKISRKLIRQATVDPAALVMDRLAYRFSVVEENVFLTGDGDKKPLGLFTATSEGISTARDITTGNTTDFTADGLINAFFFLKGPYRKNAKWLLHRFAIRNIRKLKDGEGEYIWQSGLDSGQGPNILGIPIVESEFAPHTFTNGLYAGMLADFSYYWIADALDMQVQVLLELYARSNQIGYIARKETDGMPVLEEAFVRLAFGS